MFDHLCVSGVSALCSALEYLQWSIVNKHSCSDNSLHLCPVFIRALTRTKGTASSGSPHPFLTVSFIKNVFYNSTASILCIHTYFLCLTCVSVAILAQFASLDFIYVHFYLYFCHVFCLLLS